jgi:Ca2+-binding RTX toxin-like protein
MATVTGTDASEKINSADGVTQGNDTILGLGGNDKIFGLGGRDLILGGLGADTIDGGLGIDTADYSDSSTGVVVSLATGAGHGGTAEDDVLISIENLIGSLHDDTLIGGSDVNVLSGGQGDDRLTGGEGADLLSGGAGRDTADYYDSLTGVSVSLTTGEGRGGTAEGDRLSNIEVLSGSNFNDSLTGDASDNALIGMDGNDGLSGLDGDDRLFGGAGNDTLKGGGGADRLEGGVENDLLIGGLGDDMLIGGEGNDTASYFDSQAGVTVNLGTGAVSGGTAQGDTLIGIENVTGSSLSDTLTGDGLANRLDGDDANDTLRGGAGADTLIGGEGHDTLFGGDGADTFIWRRTDETAATLAAADDVFDFSEAAGDLLDVSLIDADTIVTGNQSFSFIGTDAFTEAGQINWFSQGGNTYIALNTDADSGAEAFIEVAGLQTVEASWFLL